MVSKKDLLQPLVYSRDYVADQSWDGVQRLLGTASFDFDATYGLGSDTADSVLWALPIGGFDDQEAVAVCRYTSPSTAGDEEMGVLLRFQTNHSPDATYYYARIDAQDAKITRVVDGTFTTLTSAAFALPADTDVTITFSVVGEDLSATFEASGVTTVNLSTTDSQITTGGLAGLRTQNSAGYFASVDVTQL